jgi:hypothetical protein
MKFEAVQLFKRANSHLGWRLVLFAKIEYKDTPIGISDGKQVL